MKRTCLLGLVFALILVMSCMSTLAGCAERYSTIPENAVFGAENEAIGMEADHESMKEDLSQPEDAETPEFEQEEESEPEGTEAPVPEQGEESEPEETEAPAPEQGEESEPEETESPVPEQEEESEPEETETPAPEQGEESEPEETETPVPEQEEESKPEETETPVPEQEEESEPEETETPAPEQEEESEPEETEAPAPEQGEESEPEETESPVPEQEEESEPEETESPVPEQEEESEPEETETPAPEQEEESEPEETETPAPKQGEESELEETETPVPEQEEESEPEETETPGFEQDKEEAEDSTYGQEETEEDNPNTKQAEEALLLTDENFSCAEDGSLLLAAEENVLSEFETEGQILKKYNGNDSYVVIPESIKIIGEKAFAGNKQIKQVAFPDSVQTIDNYAFDGCTSLEYIVLSPKSKLTTIKAYAFRNAEKLNLSFAGFVKNIDETAFTGINVPEPETDESDNGSAKEMEISAVSEGAGEKLPLSSAEEQRTETEEEKPALTEEEHFTADVITEESIMETDEYVLPENVTVALEVIWDDDEPAVGSVAHLMARINGAEDIDYTLQWQWSADNIHWRKIHGATGAQYDMVVTEQNQRLYLRVQLSVVQ